MPTLGDFSKHYRGHFHVSSVWMHELRLYSSHAFTLNRKLVLFRPEYLLALFYGANEFWRHLDFFFGLSYCNKRMTVHLGPARNHNASRGCHALLGRHGNRDLSPWNSHALQNSCVRRRLAILKLSAVQTGEKAIFNFAIVEHLSINYLSGIAKWNLS